MYSDFRGIIGAKYRPGYCHLPDGTHVVSISTKVSDIGVEPRALHAWDAKLLVPNTYLVLLIAFERYPISAKDYAAARTTRVVVGLSPKAKPSKSAIAVSERDAGTSSLTVALSFTERLSFPFVNEPLDRRRN